MITVYLVCFTLGLTLSLLAAFSGLGRIHFGSIHGHGTHLPLRTGSSHISAFNGFTLSAFLCWFGGAGYLLDRFSPLFRPVVLLVAVGVGITGASLFYTLIFKLLLPRERVLSAEDTRMEGTLASVSNEVRAIDGIGEILFSQAGTRRSAPARSEDGAPIARGTEVVVLRYEHGVAYIRPLHDLSPDTPSTNS